jgi:hypothetical protein
MKLKIENFEKLENQPLSSTIYPLIHSCREYEDSYDIIIHGDLEEPYENCSSEVRISLNRDGYEGMYKLEDMDDDIFIQISKADVRDMVRFKKKLLDMYIGYYEWDED